MDDRRWTLDRSSLSSAHHPPLIVRRPLSAAHCPPSIVRRPSSIIAMIVYKLDEKGREAIRYPAALIERGEGFVCLEAFFNRDDIDLGYTIFKRGDRFVEYFYSDRWYNLFVVYDRDDGRHKGWYANICRPAEIEPNAVRCEDLALDLWVDPDGEYLILDKEEFDALDLTPQERAKGKEALSTLLQMVDNGALVKGCG